MVQEKRIGENFTCIITKNINRVIVYNYNNITYSVYFWVQFKKTPYN